MDKNLDAILADLKKDLSQEEQGYLSQKSENALNDMVMNAVEKETSIERKTITIDRIKKTIEAYKNLMKKVLDSKKLNFREQNRVNHILFEQIKRLGDSITLIEDSYTKAQKRASKRNPNNKAIIIQPKDNKNSEPVI